MKKQVQTLIVMFVLGTMTITGQTYVNEMTKAEIEADCYIEGGGTVFNDVSTEFYNDVSYVQKVSAETPTAFIFNRDLVDNKFLTGFKINMLLRMADTPEDWIKIEYSLDEVTYLDVPDMKVEFSYDAVLGGGYWADVYYQAALPANVKEIKVTLLAKPDDANWIPCYRRTEIFYETGTAYAYATPPYLFIPPTYPNTFSVNFETEGEYIADTSGSENEDSYAKVIANPKIDAVNGSNYVLELKQVPSEPEEWGWENGDWFGAAIAVNDGNDEKQMTEITESGKYLHFSIYRTNNTTFGMETWGGSAGLKEQSDFTAEDGWKHIVIDLSDYIGKTFDAFYFSPNVFFETNGVQEAELCYIDNIYLSDTETVGLQNIKDNGALVSGQKGYLTVENAVNETINIYNISGMLVSSAVLSNGTINFTLPEGIYIVKIGGNVSKVIVF